MTTKNKDPRRVPESQHKGRRAITLIEVIAATLILGTMVTILLTMQGLCLERMRELGHDLLASELAEELFVTWRWRAEEHRGDEQGRMEEHPDWSWVRRSEEVDVGPEIKAVLVTLTVRRDRGAPPGEVYRREFQWLDHRKSER